MLLQREAQQRLRVRIAAISGAAIGILVVIGIATFLFSRNTQVAVTAAPAAAPPVTIAPSRQAAPHDTAAVDTPSTAATVGDQAAATSSPPSEPIPVEPVSSEAPAARSEPSGWTKLDVDPRILAFQSPERVWLSAYDAASGRLALNDDANSSIAFHNIDDLIAGEWEPVASIKTTGPPSAIVYKNFKDRRLLIVAGRNAAKISVYDADSLEHIGDAPIDDRCYVSVLLASENRQDPYVFYSIGGVFEGEPLGPFQKDVKNCGRIDLGAMKRDPLFQIHDNEHAKDGALSPDGELLYYRSPVSPTGVNVVRWRGVRYDGDRGGRLIDEHSDVGPYVVDPNANIIYESGRAHARDMIGRSYLRLEFVPMAFFRQLPVLVGMEYNELVFGSANDYRKLSTIALPEDWFPPKDWRTREDKRRAGELPTDFRRRSDIGLNDAGFLNIFADDSRRLAIVTLIDQLIIVPLDKLKLPNEPNLTPQSSLPLFAYVGEEIVVPFRASPAAKVEIAKFTGKGDVRVETDGLHWTPAPADTGRQILHLRASQGDASHEWQWAFHVGYRPIEAPFDVEGFRMEPSKRVRAVVWGSIREPFAKDDARRHYIGVVDFQQGKFLAHRRMQRPVYTAAMSTSHLYVAPASPVQQVNIPRGSAAPQIIKMSLPGLEAEDQVVVTVDHSGLHIIADQYLAIGDYGQERFTIPALKPLPAPRLGPHEKLVYRRVSDGWVWESVLYDEQFKEAQLLISSPEVTDQRDFLSRPELGRETFEFPGELTLTEYGEFRPPLPFHSDEKDEPKFRLLVTYLPGIRHTPTTDAPGKHHDWGADFVATLYGGKLYRIPFSDFNVAKVDTLKFQVKQSTFVLNLARPTRVHYEARGADRYRLSLIRPHSSEAYFSDESRDGDFTIPAMDEQQQRWVAHYATEAVKRFQYDQQRQRGARAMVRACLEEAAAKYGRSLGKKPDGVILPIRAKVTAETEAGEMATLEHYYLVEVPIRALREQLQHLEAQTR